MAKSVLICDFIVKPFQADRVLEAVKKAIG